MQAEVDRLVASWMESLGSVQRLWDVEAIAAALSGEGDDTRKPTPLADLIDGEGFRSLGEGLRNALQAAYRKAEDFKQVGKDTCEYVTSHSWIHRRWGSFCVDVRWKEGHLWHPSLLPL
jgi:hypothetical protein